MKINNHEIGTVRITSLRDVKSCLDTDRRAMGFENKSVIKEWLKGNTDNVKLYLFIIRLRLYEYLFNKYHLQRSGGYFLHLYLLLQNTSLSECKENTVYS